MYDPHPAAVGPGDLPAELRPLLERIAEQVHDTWAAGRMAEGWRYAPEHSAALRTHPCLRPYAELSDREKEYDRRTAAQTIRCLLDMGFEIRPAGGRQKEARDRVASDQAL